MAEHDFQGSLFPVFVTADLPIETINDIFTRCKTYTAEEDPDDLEGLVLVTGATPYSPTKPSSAPVDASFKSPYLGKSILEMQHIFEESFAPHDHEEDTPKATSVFAVLDARTAKDKTVLLVSLEGDELIQIRAEPEVAALIAMGPEVNGESLDEDWPEETKGPDGVLLVTKKLYEETLAEEPDLEG